MRSFVLIAVGALALVLAGASRPAVTATKTVKITATAFSPASVTIKTTDAIKWSNTDTKAHQVVANNGAFASPTIGAATPIILYGQTTSIAGTVSTGQANEKVDVYAQPYGAPSATLVASLLTGTSGAWAVSVKPSWATTYSAHWKSTVSSTVSVGVRPTISFTIGRHQRAAVKVKAASSHAGRKVYIQRFTKFHEWVKFRAVVLGSSSGRAFRLHLKRGRYTLRAFMSINQAGTGYLEGYSRTIVFRVR